MRKLTIVKLIFVSILVLVYGCGGGGGGGGTNTPATLTAVSVTPANTTLTAGSTQQLTATGSYSDSTTKDITASVTWASNNQGIATVNATGLVSIVSSGTATITATSGSISGHASLTVTPTVAIIKISTAGTLSPGTSISGIGVTITNKNGVTVKTNASGYPLSTVVVASGLTSGNASVVAIPYVQPTASSVGKLDFVITSSQPNGFSIGEFVTVTYDIAAGTFPVAGDFVVTEIKPLDLNSAAIAGLTATITADIH